MISSISGSQSMQSMTQMRQQMFSRVDTNGDGTHDKDELAAMVANGPSGGPTVDEILKQFDTDGDGAISQSEFDAGQNQTQGAGGPPPPPPTGNMSSEDFLQQLFSDSDTDGDGTLSSDELTDMVANGPKGGPSVDELLGKVDTNGDGSVSQSEFLAGAPNKEAQKVQRAGLEKLYSDLGGVAALK